MLGAGHRHLLVLAGPREWAVAAARAYLDGVVWWVSDAPPAALPGGPAASCRRLLGGELDVLVFDAWAGFDPEAFGAAVGTVRGGGRVLLLTPALEAWPRYPDPEHARIAVHPVAPGEVSGRFLRRLAAQVAGSADVTCIGPDDPLPGLPPLPPAPVPADDPCRTADQAAAVAAIAHVVHGHPHRPLVLTSDRGRGKSAALGIAAAQLLRAGLTHVLVTAPRLEAADTLFAHAARLLPGAQLTRGRLTLGNAVLEFVAPDALVLEPRPAGLLLVDEAAAIPTPLLERLLERHARIVFATTIHGYEGTGRGFAVRFQQVLEQRTPGWQSLRLSEPIRWAADDPVERFTFRALLLEAAPAADGAVLAARVEECSCERLDRDALVQDEALLSQLFGLLVLAHYRTSPLDLRHLLDGPNVGVWVMRWQGQVVATALTAREGGFDADLARAVYEGRRRPRGHLIPQSLALHSGFAAAPQLRGDRIMRIAVHPAVQRRGLGSRLLQAIVEQARADGCDFVGASFGATPELLVFWQRHGLWPVRLGLTREAASGTHSVIVLQPLSGVGHTLHAALRERFGAHLPALLGDGVEEIEPALAQALLRDAPRSAPTTALDAQDWRDVESFVRGWRGYEVCQVPIARLAQRALADAVTLAPAQAALLLQKVLQHRPWGTIVAEQGYAGRAQALAALREVVGILQAHYRDPTTTFEGDTLI